MTATPGQSRVFSTSAAVTPAFTPLPPSRSKRYPNVAPPAAWVARSASHSYLPRVMNGPRSSASEYGVSKVRFRTGSHACQTAAASAPATGPLRRTGSCSSELFADDLAHDRAVGTAGDLRHDIGHHATEVGHARRPDLRDGVVDDLLDLILAEGLGHELLEDLELALLGRGLRLAAAGAEGVCRLDSPLALALQHLQLLVLGERPHQLLLGVLQRVQDQAESVATLRIACAHRLFDLVF